MILPRHLSDLCDPETIHPPPLSSPSPESDDLQLPLELERLASLRRTGGADNSSTFEDGSKTNTGFHLIYSCSHKYNYGNNFNIELSLSLIFFIL